METNQMKSHKKWITNLVKKETENKTLKHRKLQKEAQPGNHRQDESRGILESLMSDGYDIVIWDASNSMHSICRELHGQQWTMEEFLSGLEFDAPIFERTHPGDVNCFLVVTGPELDSVTVDSYGNMGNA